MPGHHKLACGKVDGAPPHTAGSLQTGPVHRPVISPRSDPRRGVFFCGCRTETQAHVSVGLTPGRRAHGADGDSRDRRAPPPTCVPTPLSSCVQLTTRVCVLCWEQVCGRYIFSQFFGLSGFFYSFFFWRDTQSHAGSAHIRARCDAHKKIKDRPSAITHTDHAHRQHGASRQLARTCCRERDAQ